MVDALATALIAVSLGLALWAGVCAALDRLPPKSHLQALFALQALVLAQERYRVGLNTFVDVAQSRGDYERAENDRINAIYDYHKAFAALESAVGRPLR